MPVFRLCFSASSRASAGLLLLAACGNTAQAQAPIAQQKKAPSSAITIASKDGDEALDLEKALAVSNTYEAGSDSAAASTNGLGPVGIVPVSKGFTMSIGTTSQHDSASGWTSLLTPNVAYRFGRHLSLNVGVPIYSYYGIYGVVSTKSATKTTPATPVYGIRPDTFLIGDTNFAFQFEAHPAFFDYNVSTTVAAPTGDDADGLGAGTVTYNVNNHFERPITRWLTPDIEIGIGNSPNLVDSRVRKSYIDVGTNAHFQAGLNLELPWHMSFTTDAYEELPLGVQTVTSTTTNGKKGKDLRTIVTTTSFSVGEDSGFLDTLDIPLNDHVTLSGFYNRSLRNKIDTTGFSFTFLLKSSRSRESGR